MAEQRLGHSCHARVQCDDLPSSSWALAISLSAMASGFTLKVPSAMACEMRATFSASKSLPDVLTPDISVAAAVEISTLALASVAPGVTVVLAVSAGVARPV